MLAVVPVVPIVFLVRALLNRAQGGRPAVGTTQLAIVTWRTAVWLVAAVMWTILFVFVMVMIVPIERGAADLAVWAATLGAALAFLVLTPAMVAPWAVLRPLARKGRPRMVYALAHATLVFPWTAQTRPGAVLLAALAIAHRGVATTKEIEWLRSRLEPDRRALGTFGAALGLIDLLEARMLRDAGRLDDASRARERGCAHLSTVLYMPSSAVPLGVRKLAYELLALDAAKRAEWGVFEDKPLMRMPPVHRALAGWVKAVLRGGRATLFERYSRRSLASPSIEALFERSAPAVPPASAEEARAVAAATYAAVVRGEDVVPRCLLSMLSTFDTMLDPSSEGCVLPEEIRGDEVARSAIQDEVAAALVTPLARTYCPMRSLASKGPISSRVHHELELVITAELDRAVAAIAARNKAGERLSAMGEWTDVSRVRALFARLEYMFGHGTAGRSYTSFMVSYSKMGVGLSESKPRMRPLAHAVFRYVWHAAIAYNDANNARIMYRNTEITVGIA